MDFDLAVSKLNRDHHALRKSKLRQNQKGLTLTAKQKQQRDERQRIHREKQSVIQKKKQRLDFARDYQNRWEKRLGTLSLKCGGEGSTSTFRPTSIHGDGDKIALPVSVLEYLTKEGGMELGSQPLTFRVGLLNPEYSFPSSPSLVTKMEGFAPPSEEMDVFMEGDDDDEEETAVEFTDELECRYLAHTHATVVEFTQEENCVGLPRSVADRLLSSDAVPTTRTKDPSGETGDESAENTPGHLAWGCFDVPALEVEVTLVSLPKGTGCTLIPSEEAFRNGFGNLKDVKVVLEQSLERTRATLSVNDKVYCWHRGVKFDLHVSSVTPPTFHAVSCINTDIEVDIGVPDIPVPPPVTEEEAKEPSTVATAGGGRTLRSLTPSTSSPARPHAPVSPLPEEPPIAQTLNICRIQIRGDGMTARRRFDVETTTARQLFCFAAMELGLEGNFRLVARFPRKVLESTEDSLRELGVNEGQELFMVERL